MTKSKIINIIKKKQDSEANEISSFRVSAYESLKTKLASNSQTLKVHVHGRLRDLSAWECKNAEFVLRVKALVSRHPWDKFSNPEEIKG